MKNVFIRGSVVRYVHLPGSAVDTALLEDGMPASLLLPCPKQVLIDPKQHGEKRNSKHQKRSSLWDTEEWRTIRYHLGSLGRHAGTNNGLWAKGNRRQTDTNFGLRYGLSVATGQWTIRYLALSVELRAGKILCLGMEAFKAIERVVPRIKTSKLKCSISYFIGRESHTCHKLFI